MIIVDSTDPVGPAEGLFAEPFYRSCLRALSPQGIVVAQSESPLLHMQILTDMRRAMRAAGFNHMATLQFPQCCYPSGWWSGTMASKTLDVSNFRQTDAANRTFTTQFYSEATHRG
ncbi:MAG: spermidine synthase, partial [Halothiobacillaceae bacterium]